MLIEVGTPRYQELFGHRDFLTTPFESRLPPYSLFVQALGDPSKRIDAIDAIVEDARPEGLLQTIGLQDLHLGSQYLMHARVAASRLGGILTLPGNGILGTMQTAIVDVMKQVKIPARATDAEIQAFLADASFAIGMRALGAAGPIGKIAAAIVGFARGIVQLVRQRRAMEKMDKERREALAYAKLPPLQEPDHQIDSWYVDSVLRSKLETGSWTGIFAPRFQGEWKALRRNGGMALAPGERTSGIDDFGRATDVFVPDDGIGIMPGVDRLTSVIQVAVDPTELNTYTSGRWPIRPEMVTDVGQFFVNTGRLGAIAWSWATEVDGSPDLYKIDTRVLDDKWREYCEGGLRLLRTITLTTIRDAGGGRAEQIAASAIGCALGVWRCMPDGNGFREVSPGWEPHAMKGFGIGREVLGCVMDPSALVAAADGKACLFTIYDRRIKKVLEDARRRQRYFLWHSLVAAYVRADWDAFKDKPLHDQLMRARVALLEHPDRYLVDLDDVADDEPGLPGSTDTWKEQLIARGVRRRHPFLVGNKRLSGGANAGKGQLKPPTEPPPRVPVYEGPIAWGDLPEPRRSPWGHIMRALGSAALFGGAVALSRRGDDR